MFCCRHLGTSTRIKRKELVSDMFCHPGLPRWDRGLSPGPNGIPPATRLSLGSNVVVEEPLLVFKKSFQTHKHLIPKEICFIFLRNARGIDVFSRFQLLSLRPSLPANLFFVIVITAGRPGRWGDKGDKSSRGKIPLLPKSYLKLSFFLKTYGM